MEKVLALTWGLSCVACWDPCGRALCAAGSPHPQLRLLLPPGHPCYPGKTCLFPARFGRSRRCLLVSRTPSKGWDCIPKTGQGWGAERAWTGPKMGRDACLALLLRVLFLGWRWGGVHLLMRQYFCPNSDIFISTRRKVKLLSLVDNFSISVLLLADERALNYKWTPHFCVHFPPIKD